MGAFREPRPQPADARSAPALPIAREPRRRLDAASGERHALLPARGVAWSRLAPWLAGCARAGGDATRHSSAAHPLARQRAASERRRGLYGRLAARELAWRLAWELARRQQVPEPQLVSEPCEPSPSCIARVVPHPTLARGRDAPWGEPRSPTTARPQRLPDARRDRRHGASAEPVAPCPRRGGGARNVRRLRRRAC